MSKLRLQFQEKKLDALLLLMEKIDNESLKSHFAKYICVRISGYLENVVKALISQYIENSCPIPIKSFVKNKLKNVTNLSSPKLLSFLETFDKNWKTDLENKLSKEQKTALNNIVGNRNKIVHGGVDNITPQNIRTYYEDIKEVVKLLKEIIKK